MKSFAVDENPIDIEELDKLRKCQQSSDGKCVKKCQKSKKVHLINEMDEWYAPNSLEDLLALLKEYKSASYRLISGNTGVGVYKNDGPFNVFIDIKNISSLYQVSHNNNELTLGAALSINNLIELFETFSKVEGFEYLSNIAKHFSKIANVAVRNTGSWSGNLAMKNEHLDFPSDVFICFESVGAKITLIDSENSRQEFTPVEFLSIPLAGRLILSVTFKAINPRGNYFQTFKIMPRSQNAHAYVNAAFRLTLNSANQVINSTIVFGGIQPSFVHATKTEKFLRN